MVKRRMRGGFVDTAKPGMLLLLFLGVPAVIVSVVMLAMGLSKKKEEKPAPTTVPMTPVAEPTTA